MPVCPDGESAAGEGRDAIDPLTPLYRVLYSFVKGDQGMATHEWEYELGFGTGRATVTTDAVPPGCIDWSIPDADFSADDEILAREILRLAEENVRLRLEVESRDATLHMTVARLGGEVEGAPTHRINFLQRVDALVRQERSLRILAHEMWVCLKEDLELDPEANREALEAAGLIEMLADQTWSLTELGGRVCRRES